MKLSVVIPVYNEKATIQTVVSAVQAVTMEKAMQKEIIVVDDASTDGTREVLAAMEAGSHDVRVLLHEYNQGKGAALRTGFQAATGDLVVVQDADLEYSPAEYPRLIEPILAGSADVVYGSRFLAASLPGKRWHAWGNRFLTFLSNCFTGFHLTDMETCYKVFRREIIQSITIQENRFGVEPEVTAKLAKKGLRIVEVPIGYRGRSYAEGKKIGWKDLLRAIWCIVKYRR